MHTATDQQPVGIYLINLVQEVNVTAHLIGWLSLASDKNKSHGSSHWLSSARFVKTNPHTRSGPQPSVTAMVEDLGWETLQNRRLNNRLTLLYKIINDQVEIPANYHPVLNNNRDSRRCHNQQFTRLQSDINIHKFSFIPRTIVDWNNLPSDVVAAKSLDSFKKRLHAR